jgi:hypothetical protein
MQTALVRGSRSGFGAVSLRRAKEKALARKTAKAINASGGGASEGSLRAAALSAAAALQASWDTGTKLDAATMAISFCRHDDWRSGGLRK